MKKYFVFLFGVVAALASCDHHYTTTVVGSTQKIVDVKVDAKQWQYTDPSGKNPYDNNYFYATVNVPEITENVFDNGQVQAYIVYDRNSKDAMQHLLPYVRHYEEQLSDSTWTYYTETTDCVFGIGWIEFNYRASDFAYEDDVTINPNTMDFRVVITTPAK